MVEGWLTFTGDRPTTRSIATNTDAIVATASTKKSSPKSDLEQESNHGSLPTESVGEHTGNYNSSPQRPIVGGENDNRSTVFGEEGGGVYSSPSTDKPRPESLEPSPPSGGTAEDESYGDVVVELLRKAIFAAFWLKRALLSKKYRNWMVRICRWVYSALRSPVAGLLVRRGLDAVAKLVKFSASVDAAGGTTKVSVEFLPTR